jgi:hypothetical protein
MMNDASLRLVDEFDRLIHFYPFQGSGAVFKSFLKKFAR